MAEITEAEFQAQVVQLAEMLGWQWAHFRPAKTAHGWRTPVSGPLGKGFPDLVLAHPKRGIVFAELKRGPSRKADPDQLRVVSALLMAGARVYVWMPSDLDEIAEVLGGQ